MLRRCNVLPSTSVHQVIRTGGAFLITCSVALHANAEPTKTEVAVARQYFEQANAAERENRWADAIEDLNRAVAIKETAGLRYHLGFAKENMGMLVDAMLEYQRAAGLLHS